MLRKDILRYTEISMGTLARINFTTLVACLVSAIAVALTVSVSHAYPFSVGAARLGPVTPAVYRAAVKAQISELLSNVSADAEWASVVDFYTERGFEPAWVTDQKGRARLTELQGIFADAFEHGLNAERYSLESSPSTNPVQSLSRRDGQAAEMRELALRDLKASATLVRYVSDLKGLNQDSRAVRHRGAVEPQSLYANAMLRAASQAPNLRSHLEGEAPSNRIYTASRAALERYRQLAEAGGWPLVATGKRIEPGHSSRRIPEVRKRLFATGDFVGADLESTLYDLELREAVVRFQERHGLDQDAIIGRQTVASMRITAEQRVQQIMANLERARWLPTDLGRRYVMVNVPEFKLRVIEDGQEVMDMAIIVGRRYRQTPILSSEFSVLELNPYWYVPESIARKDYLPQLIEDPWHKADKGMRLFAKDTRDELERYEIDFANLPARRALPYRMRQDPGPDNALGRVKFLFDNPFAVYLHDTPSRQLFTETERTFSSGCIRIERPLEMAEYLLKDKGDWSREVIDEIVDSGLRRRVYLDESVSVHLIYNTAWMGDDGSVQFRRDIYGRDQYIVDKLLARRDAELVSKGT